MRLVDKLVGWMRPQPRVSLHLDLVRVVVGGPLAGRVELVGARRAHVVRRLEIRLVRVQPDLATDSPSPSSTVERVVADNVIGADVEIAARHTVELAFAIWVPTDAEPSSSSVHYRVDAIATLGSGSLSTTQAVELRGIGPESVGARWPALRGGDDDEVADTLREILRAFDDGDPGLSGSGRPIASAIEPWMLDGSRVVRRAAMDAWIRALQTSAGELEPAALEPLRRAIAAADGDPGLRRHVASTAARARNAGLGLLVDLAADPDPEVRRAAITGLRETSAEDSSVRSILVAALGDDVPIVRVAAVRTLAVQARSPEALGHLFERMDAEVDHAVLGACIAAVRGAAVEGSSELVRSFFSKMSRHPDARVRHAVAEALFVAVDPSATTMVTRLLADGSSGVRAAAAAELRGAGSSGAVFAERLRAMATDDDATEVRAAALRALPEFLSTEDMVTLGRRLLDEDVSEEVLLGLVEGLRFRRDAAYTELLREIASRGADRVAVAAETALAERS